MNITNRKPQIKCPYCHAFSQMDVMEGHFPQDSEPSPLGSINTCSLEIRRCSNCGGKFFYIDGELMYPEPESQVPNPDMPGDVKALFEEAASISHRSPRAACALLRLAIEVLCRRLTSTEANIDAMISSLVKRGLSKEVQEALDVVRVVGNNAVHPGQISFDVDDESTATMLFGLLNIITERLISEPSLIKSLYEGLPDSVREHVSKRDKQ